MTEEEDDKVKTLFVSHSIARAGWYRCVLPAMWGGWDWAAIAGRPPELTLVSSWVDQGTFQPDFLAYDVIVFEQVRGVAWANLIRKLRKRGIIVLYEIDDYVHGIRHADDHDFRGYYTKENLREHNQCMRECNGAIVSTQYLYDKYQPIFRDRPMWVCENGLDMGRYRLTRPERGELAGRETVTIMWSGATGHQRAVLPWLAAVREVMVKFPHVSFVSIGQDFSNLLHDEFPNRVLTLPFTALETYPAAMTLGDVSIAPAGRSDWYQAKSTLRAMESAALGIPVVADKHYASAIIDGETGIIVQRDAQVIRALSELISDDDRRTEMSKKAREHALATFSMEHRVGQWTEALSEAVERCKR